MCRHEFKNNHGEWIAKEKPHLSRTIEARVQRAVFSPNSEALRFIAIQVREEIRTVMNNLLKVWSSLQYHSLAEIRRLQNVFTCNPFQSGSEVIKKCYARAVLPWLPYWYLLMCTSLYWDSPYWYLFIDTSCRMMQYWWFLRCLLYLQNWLQLQMNWRSLSIVHILLWALPLCRDAVR